MALAHRFSSNRETAGSLTSPQPSYDAKRPLRRRKEGADKGRGVLGKTSVLWEMHKWRIIEVRTLTLKIVSRAVP